MSNMQNLDRDEIRLNSIGARVEVNLVNLPADP